MVRISVPVNTFGMDFRMYTIGARVKEERERLGLTIPEFAEAAGVKKNTVIDWQKDVSSPPAARLASLASAGVDVQYIIIGVRSAPLVGDEAKLLEGFRSLNKEMQKYVLAGIHNGNPLPPSQTVLAYQGQAAGGNITNDFRKK